MAPIVRHYLQAYQEPDWSVADATRTYTIIVVVN